MQMTVIVAAYSIVHVVMGWQTPASNLAERWI